MEVHVSVQRGPFDLDQRYAALPAAGDPLEKLVALIEFRIGIAFPW
ncbi:MAG: hypothetical protein KGL48_00350 [Sphingomonadales bacterium]|nr:hypothetical protein [Sphingomonadales bacterium]